VYTHVLVIRGVVVAAGGEGDEALADVEEVAWVGWWQELARGKSGKTVVQDTRLLHEVGHDGASC
jgi:hypothetical protein